MRKLVLASVSGLTGLVSIFAPLLAKAQITIPTANTTTTQDIIDTAHTALWTWIPYLWEFLLNNGVAIYLLLGIVGLVFFLIFAVFRRKHGK